LSLAFFAAWWLRDAIEKGTFAETAEALSEREDGTTN